MLKARKSPTNHRAKTTSTGEVPRRTTKATGAIKEQCSPLALRRERNRSCKWKQLMLSSSNTPYARATRIINNSLVGCSVLRNKRRHPLSELHSRGLVLLTRRLLCRVNLQTNRRVSLWTTRTSELRPISSSRAALLTRAVPMNRQSNYNLLTDCLPQPSLQLFWLTSWEVTWLANRCKVLTAHVCLYWTADINQKIIVRRSVTTIQLASSPLWINTIQILPLLMHALLRNPLEDSYRSRPTTCT